MLFSRLTGWGKVQHCQAGGGDKEIPEDKFYGGLSVRRLVETHRKDREFKNMVVPLKLKIGYV